MDGGFHIPSASSPRRAVRADHRAKCPWPGEPGLFAAWGRSDCPPVRGEAWNEWRALPPQAVAVRSAVSDTLGPHALARPTPRPHPDAIKKTMMPVRPSSRLLPSVPSQRSASAGSRLSAPLASPSPNAPPPSVCCPAGRSRFEKPVLLAPRCLASTTTRSPGAEADLPVTIPPNQLARPVRLLASVSPNGSGTQYTPTRRKASSQEVRMGHELDPGLLPWHCRP